MGYYQHHVFICTNQRDNNVDCCANLGAKALLDYAKEQAKALKLTGKSKCRVNSSGCMDRCAEGPVLVVYPDEVWYTFKDKADIDEILVEHLQNGRIVERLQI